MSFLTALFAFGVVLVPLIIIHEFGHMLAGKSIGVTILEFGLGFPPRVAKLFTWGETEFTLNAIPLGGFVMPYGEDFIKPQSEDEMAEVQKNVIQKRGIQNAKSVFEATPLQKIWFLFAGPLANFIAAFVLFVLLGLTGILAPRSDVTVTEILPDTPAADTNLQAGDVITAANGESFDISPDLAVLIEDAADPIVLTVKRGAETLDVTINPVAAGEDMPIERIGISEVQPDTPAEEAGFLENDLIVSVNDEAILSITQMSDITNANENTEMIVTVRRDGELVDVPVTPQRLEDESRARIGIGLNTMPVLQNLGVVVDDQNVEFYNQRYSILESLRYGADNVREAFSQIFAVPGMIARGELTAAEARPVSVVGVSQLGAEIIKNNPYQDVIVFAALISIALGLTNLLPIPGLDGGRILFAIIEMVRGKPMAPEREGLVHLIGIGLLLSLMVILVINDLVNPITDQLR